MSALARVAALKFIVCALIAVFIVVCIGMTYPAGLFKTALYVCAGGVCIRMAWPTQDEGDALLKGGDNV